MAQANGKELQELKRQMKELLHGKATLADALELSLEDILALSQVARQFADQGQLDNAQVLLEGLVALDPQNPYLFTCLGCVYMQKKLNKAALDSFLIALKYNPEDIVAHTYAGEIALENGDVDWAVKHFQKAVELDPQGKDPYANRARTSALLVSTIVKEVQAKGPQVLQEIAKEAKRVQGQT